MWAEWIVEAAAVYATVGLLFAAAFVICGARALDPAARHSGWGFRLLILPAAAALWPLLATKWWRT